MKVTHSFNIEAKCPSMPGHVDQYLCELTVDKMVLVEEIRPRLERILAEPIYQEDLAQAIADAFGAKVQLGGQHPGGFTTIVETE